MTALDDLFARVGTEGVMSMTDAKLVAGANSLENFTLWASGWAECAIVGAWDTDNAEHVEWANAYCKGDPRKDQQPIVRRACAAAYAELNDPWAKPLPPAAQPV